MDLLRDTVWKLFPGQKYIRNMEKYRSYFLIHVIDIVKTKVFP